MKNNFLILLLLIPFIGFGNFKINGSIQNYENKPVIIKIYEDGVSRAIQRVVTNEKGEFSYKMPKTYTGTIDLELTQGTVQIVAFNEDVNFHLSILDPIRKIHYTGGKASKLDQFLNIKELYDLRDFTLKEILNYYKKSDAFYQALEKEIERINQLETNLPDDPAIKYYVNTKEKLNNYNRGLLTPQAIVTDLEITMSKDPDYLEQFGFLPEMLSVFLSNATAGASSRLDMENKMENALDRLLEETVAETSRGQAILSTAIAMFEGYRFNNLSNKYTRQVSEMNCTLNENLQLMLNASTNMNIGDKVPNIKFNHAVNGKNSLYDIQADKKLIVFWGSWCPHCVNELPYIKEFYKNFKQSGGEILAFALEMEVQDYVVHTADTQWYNYSDLMKWDSPVIKQYGVVATPTMILVDRDNKIIKKGGRISDFVNL